MEGNGSTDSVEDSESLPVPVWVAAVVGVTGLLALLVISFCIYRWFATRRLRRKALLSRVVSSQTLRLRPLSKEMLESRTVHVQPSSIGEPVGTSSRHNSNSTLASLSKVQLESRPTLTKRDSSTTVEIPISRVRQRSLSGTVSPTLRSLRSLCKEDHSLTFSFYREEESHGTTAGKIRIGLHYDPKSSNLTVSVLECQELLDVEKREGGGAPDPYVILRMSNNKSLKYQTKVKQKTHDPKFFEAFRYHDVSLESIPHQSICFQVVNFDKSGEHRVLGVLECSLGTVQLNVERLLWLHIKAPQHQMNVECGDVLMGLGIIPTAANLTTLTVTVMKAQNLKAMTLAGNSDGKRIAKKKSEIAKGTLQPVWNVPFQLTVAMDVLKRTSVVVSIVHADRLTRRRCIGQVVVGCDCQASSLEAQHWQDMLASPHRHISRWHSLAKCTAK
ncbi:synaptotagmin-2-like isoform X2 [Corticium candelabrum]|uniref:synaptotagmin-2-like isoform X2 n=1 Tax=Corticium candelabrum TaxID=121492 RepID=UPI002E253C75|nr:synaptotagmin-2-like isoform X2 [Corticium candelabrum]